jgi:hypothetical protein
MLNSGSEHLAYPHSTHANPVTPWVPVAAAAAAATTGAPVAPQPLPQRAAARPVRAPGPRIVPPEPGAALDASLAAHVSRPRSPGSSTLGPHTTALALDAAFGSLTLAHLAPPSAAPSSQSQAQSYPLSHAQPRVADLFDGLTEEMSQSSELAEYGRYVDVHARLGSDAHTSQYAFMDAPRSLVPQDRVAGESASAGAAHVDMNAPAVPTVGWDFLPDMFAPPATGAAPAAGRGGGERK